MYAPHAIPSDYADLRRFLAGRRERRIAHNTFAVAMPNGDVDIVFHVSTIASVHPDNRATLRACRWLTATTRTRQNAVMGPRGRVANRDRVTHLLRRGETPSAATVWQGWEDVTLPAY